MQFVRMVVASAVLGAALAAPAAAQLPKVPGADKVPGNEPAVASQPGQGGGALEPYLVTLLLPVGGIVMAGAGLLMDRRIRANGGG